MEHTEMISEVLRETIRENPISSVLAGLGIGWSLVGCAKKMFVGALDRESAKETMMSGDETAEDVKDKLQQYSETAKEKTDQARSQARQWGLETVEYFKENPFRVVGAAIAIGAVVGLTTRDN
jgi:ElaB/YqjD/DUF883 family membrane-anchored ribosome-binding protein